MVKLNVLNLEKSEYKGGKSSLCPGCGHDQISNVIIQAAWENGIKPEGIAKMSGIGCSSKTPAYFLAKSHGFNTVHGRMPSVTTGANMINKDLAFIAVSGDGDTASIGIGQFIHAITKGQYSATVEKGSKKKKGTTNEQAPIDLCAMAVNLGCTFVARSFSGSKKQLTALLRAAMSHRGMAIIDVISPCVTFANNDESYRSYNYVKSNDEVLHIVDYIPNFSPLSEVEVPEGEFSDISLFDGSTLRLETVSEDHDPGDAVAALRAIHEATQEGRHVTGLLYYNPNQPTATDTLGLTDTPLVGLSDEEMRPSSESLKEVNAGFRAR